MTQDQIIRAWKDPEYRRSLSDAERAALPENPAGLMELSDEQLDGAAGACLLYFLSGLLGRLYLPPTAFCGLFDGSPICTVFGSAMCTIFGSAICIVSVGRGPGTAPCGAAQTLDCGITGAQTVGCQ